MMHVFAMSFCLEDFEGNTLTPRQEADRLFFGVMVSVGVHRFPSPFCGASLEDNISVLLGTDKINFDEFFKSSGS